MTTATAELLCAESAKTLKTTSTTNRELIYDDRLLTDSIIVVVVGPKQDVKRLFDDCDDYDGLAIGVVVAVGFVIVVEAGRDVKRLGLGGGDGDGVAIVVVVVDLIDEDGHGVVVVVVIVVRTGRDVKRLGLGGGDGDDTAIVVVVVVVDFVDEDGHGVVVVVVNVVVVRTRRQGLNRVYH